MAIDDKISLKLHGLDVHKDAVRAEVFATKLRTLVSALKSADKEINGASCYEFLIYELRKGSALAEIREVQKSTKKRPVGSSVRMVKEVARDVYEGNVRDIHASEIVLRKIRALGKGAGRSFSHAELALGDRDKNVIRIDEFFERQGTNLVNALVADESVAADRHYKGRVFGSFDGVLKAVDLRGDVKRASLFLTAGGVEIDCVVNAIEVENLGENLDKRVTVEGLAFYDGESQMPARIDIRSIAPVRSKPDLVRWAGRFQIRPDEDGVDEDW
ncbi:MAG: hypothetical protein ACXWC8_21290 [Limisphaerales bacterium]